MPSSSKKAREIRANLAEWPDVTIHSCQAEAVAAIMKAEDAHFVIMAYPKAWGTEARYQKTKNGAIIQIVR